MATPLAHAADAPAARARNDGGMQNVLAPPPARALAAGWGAPAEGWPLVLTDGLGKAALDGAAPLRALPMAPTSHDTPDSPT